MRQTPPKKAPPAEVGLSEVVHLKAIRVRAVATHVLGRNPAPPRSLQPTPPKEEVEDRLETKASHAPEDLHGCQVVDR